VEHEGCRMIKGLIILIVLLLIVAMMQGDDSDWKGA
jgi:hypothetical protein